MQQNSSDFPQSFKFIFAFCLFIFFQCNKLPLVYDGPVSFHLFKIGNGNLNVSFSDTVVDAGSKIMLKANASPGSFFLGWFGDFSSTLDSVVIFVNGNMAVEARFRMLPTSVGLVEIPSKGQTFSMGSSGPYASPEEKPVHQVRFSYTFFMDDRAIIQKDFLQVTGNNPAQARGAYGLGDSFPVYNVTWYEAVLFCNARSRAQGYDTVYSYTATCQANQSCPYVLENLAIHYDRFGYRLPTEAEWEFACRAGVSTDYFWGSDTAGVNEYAWFSGDAAGACHPVGQKLPNAFGLYDMAGNVSQWVNDQFGQYPSRLCVDPIGPVSVSEEQFVSVGTRPVRGGSWKTGTSFLRSSCRQYEYVTPAKVYAEYIGFRTVLGAFFPQVEDTSKPVVDTSGITVPVTIASDLLRVVGTSSVKCVFTKGIFPDRKLYYIDFSEPGRPAHSLADSLVVHNPTISPNGKYTAYSTNYEGFTGQSITTIRPLAFGSTMLARTSLSAAAFLPRWWTDPASGDTFVVYVNGASMNNLAVWKQEKTLRRKISQGTFSGTPETVCDTGSFHGGLSADGRFLATGYPQAFALNLKANDLYQYFLPPINGRVDTPQVCNVSISPSIVRPDEIMFLDFGYYGTSTIVGKPYGIHSIIFTCNSSLTSTDAVRWYEKPMGFDSWDDVEWSNHPDFAAAVAQTNASPEESSLFIINLKTKECLKIAEGKNLHDPWFWIDPRALPQITDPYPTFAEYDVPIASTGQEGLTEKLKLFWNQRNNMIQGAFVGSSPTYFGIDPSYISNVKALNLGAMNSSQILGLTIVNNYALPQLPNLKIIGIGLDPGQIDDFNVVNPYMTGLSRAIGYELDQTNNFWKNGLPLQIQQKIALFDSSSSWPDFFSTGFTIQKASNGWGPTLIDGTDYDFENDTIQRNFSIFKTLADTLASHGIHLLVIEFPESPAYKQTSMIGRLGPSRTTYAKIVSWLRAIEQANPYFHFYDANMDGNHDYSDAEALDCNHLGYLGARKLSMRIDSLFGTYLK
jgi:formylglycine-generating enzyme required for sulfatase activity